MVELISIALGKEVAFLLARRVNLSGIDRFTFAIRLTNALSEREMFVVRLASLLILSSFSLSSLALSRRSRTLSDVFSPNAKSLKLRTVMFASIGSRFERADALAALDEAREVRRDCAPRFHPLPVG